MTDTDLFARINTELFSAEDAAIAAAFEKVATENKVATAIRNGMSSQEAFATFGVM
ncbi:hypothetical protein [Phaeobacter sp. J2-8]|uniref:hypothetical protein n=1 Tax=Phaeobacter sp. J2-8 TaxID=2931394 RepID=UPI001FD01C2C|nr:hypothetical protein [Phaeobacter sp. J2-8]MCJ7874097.1 hypothetical protein [Phaeobacter sp. J2-8]